MALISQDRAILCVYVSLCLSSFSFSFDDAGTIYGTG